MLGTLDAPGPLLTLAGFALMLALDRRGIPGAVLIGVLAVTGVSAALGYVEWRGVFALPPDLRPTLLQLDIAGALQWSMLGTILTFLLIDVFDNAGSSASRIGRACWTRTGGCLDSAARCSPTAARASRARCSARRP